jgi:hypothetical protein
VIQATLTPPQELGLPFASVDPGPAGGVPLGGEEGRHGANKGGGGGPFWRGLRWRKQKGWFGERVDPEFAGKRGPSSASTHPLLPTPS